ncbi:MAG: FHA domain-containing protein, partial [Planctomycetes bacterium]|nr:FHA domain-containing protein [Planctomycetota bacterium]
MANYVLEILDGDRAGEVLSVADQPVRVGRKPGNDLVLADEKTSGVHAEIVLEGDRHVLRDLGSTNGTFLDGKRITELVLSPGDVITFGRLRARFRAAEAAAGASGDAGELAVRTLDRSRVQRRGGSVGILAGVLVLVAAAGGWFWWQGQQQAGEGGAVAGGNQPRPVLDVSGNKLAAEVAGCESDAAFDLRVGGVGFQPAASAHTGSAGFLAQRADATAPDFAVLRVKDALPVLTGRPLTVAAHVRSTNGGKVAVRAVLQSEKEQAPFRYRTGTALAESAAWQRIETMVAVPSGCDRLVLEVVALLPTPDATVLVDDLAVVEGGTAQPFEQKLADTGQAAAGTGSALAVRSVDSDNPAIVLQVVPGEVGPELQGLHKAELCALSDLGAVVTCTAGERSFKLAATGVESLQFVLPAEAGGGLMVAGADGAFDSATADGAFRAQSLLVGDRLTRAMLRFPADTACTSRTAAGLWRVIVGAREVELVVGFRAERGQAAELLRKAAAARDAGKPGDALDQLREVVRTLPMDTEMLGQANALRRSEEHTSELQS